MTQRDKRREWLAKQTKDTLIGLILRLEDAETQNISYNTMHREFIDKISEAIKMAGGNGSDVAHPWEFIKERAAKLERTREDYWCVKERLGGFKEGVRAVLSAQAGMEN